MEHSRAAGRRIGEVLSDTRGSIVAEMGGVIITFIVLAAVSGAAVTATAALSTFTSKVERQNAATSLVADRGTAAYWGETPSKQAVVLPNGGEAQATVWSVAKPGGIEVHAGVPVKGDGAELDCGPEGSEKACVYASGFQVAPDSSFALKALMRKDPSNAEKVGYIYPLVGANFALSTERIIAEAAPATNAKLRYLIKASTTGTGKIAIVQGTKRLATIPVDSRMKSYYGDLTPEAGTMLTIKVLEGPVVVETVYVYEGPVAN